MSVRMMDTFMKVNFSIGVFFGLWAGFITRDEQCYPS